MNLHGPMSDKISSTNGIGNWLINDWVLRYLKSTHSLTVPLGLTTGTIG